MFLSNGIHGDVFVWNEPSTLFLFLSLSSIFTMNAEMQSQSDKSANMFLARTRLVNYIVYEQNSLAPS